MNEEMPLSEDLQYWRVDRPDEWIMNRFIRKAKKLELLVGQLRAKESGVEADAKKEQTGEKLGFDICPANVPGKEHSTI